MKLKTLKDIEKEVLDLHTGILAHKIIKHIFKKIRQEAIKRAKYCNIERRKVNIREHQCYPEGRRDEAMGFANLKEEDLKNEKRN